MKQVDLRAGALIALTTIVSIVLLLALYLILTEPRWAESLAKQIVERSIHTPTQTAEAYNAAAALLNFQYGLPVAAVGAFVGFVASLVAAYFGYLVTSRQGDVQILEFVENRVRPSINHHQALTAAIEDLLISGARGRRLAEDVLEFMRTRGPRTEHVADKGPRDVGGLDDEATIRELDRRADEFLDDLTKAGARFQLALEEILVDIYSSLFCTRQLASTDQTKRPLTYLASKAPKLAKMRPHSFGETIPELADNIAGLSAATHANELFYAYDALPSDHNDVDYIGAVLLSPEVAPPHLHRHGDRYICRFRLNMGAAYILAAAQCIPDKKIVSDVFQSIFSSRSRVTKEFIKTAIPKREALGFPRTFRSVDESFSNLNRLVIVDVLDGDQTSTSYHPEFYDPTLHGEIPAWAFDPSAAPTEQQ